jgi:uncharacterized protein (TIGR02453 family)
MMDFPRLTAYLADLAQNNERAWFEAHRSEYQSLRDDFTAFVGEAIAAIAEWDEAMRWKDPKDCIFRIYRDVRFSNDKSPYKTTFSAHVSDSPRRGGPPGYYFEVDEKGTMLAAGGIWMPEPATLGRLRDSIAEHPERLQKVLRSRGFKKAFGDLQGDRLTRPPRGYSEATPLIEYVRLKSYIVWRERDVSTATHDEALAWLTDSLRAARPLVDWVRASLQGIGERE